MEPTKYDYLKGAGIAQKEAQRRLKKMVDSKKEAYGPQAGGSPDYLRALAANETAAKTPIAAQESNPAQLPSYKIQNPELLKKQRELKSNPLTDEEKKKLFEAKKEELPKYDTEKLRRQRKDGKLVDLPKPQY